MKTQIKREYYQLIQMVKNYAQFYQNMGLAGIPLPELPTFSSLKELNAYLAHCRGCLLAWNQQAVVLGEGNSELVFVGQCPAAREVKPFQGEAGELLDRILAAIGLSRKDVYLTYALKCPLVEEPDHQAIRVCRKILLQELQFLKPKIVCTFDTLPTRMLLDKQGDDLRGKIFNLRLGENQVKVIPTYSPDYLLKNPSKKMLAWQDIQLIRQEYDQAHL